MSIESKTSGTPVQEKVWTGVSGRELQQRADVFTSEQGGEAVQPAPQPAHSKPHVVKAKKAAPIEDPPAIPASYTQAMAETVTFSFIDRFKSEAARKGGTLSIEDIENLTEEFVQKTESLRVAFEKSFEDYVKSRERATMNLSREFPFDRLIVSKFAHLLKSDRELLHEDDTISRRILPGFFMAMNLMLGPEFADQHQEKSRQIVLRLSAGREREFTWEEVYNDDEATDLIFDALVAMAFYFEDIQKRIDWFVNLMNDHMRRHDEGCSPDLKFWTFTEGAFKKLLKALFSDLKDAISNEGGRLMISKKYGVDTCVSLAEILKQFK